MSIDIIENTHSDEPETTLSLLLKPFFRTLNNSNIPYCVVGNFERLPYYTENDVDVWAQDPAEVLSILKENATSIGLKHYLCNLTAAGTNNYFYSADDKSISIVKIDIFNVCAWASCVPIVSPELFFKHRVKKNDFYVLDEDIECVAHLLYPLLSFQSVKEKYRAKLQESSQRGSFCKILKGIAGDEWTEYLIHKSCRGKWNEVESKATALRCHMLMQTITAIDIDKIALWRNFFMSHLKRIFKPAGLMVAFIGPDGCGKTTLIKELSKFSNKAFIPGKLRKFYWRPYFLPPIKKWFPFKISSVNTRDEDSPEATMNDIDASITTKIIWALKFLYYWFDYIIGVVKYKTIKDRGGIIFFDRYYYDHVVYPQRFGFNMPKFVMKYFSVFVPEPDLVLSLSAAPDTLWKRKEEVNINELNSQLSCYKSIVKSIENAFIVDTSGEIHDTIHSIKILCLRRMAEKLG